jgi:hypothetical protein
MSKSLFSQKINDHDKRESRRKYITYNCVQEGDKTYSDTTYLKGTKVTCETFMYRMGMLDEYLKGLKSYLDTMINKKCLNLTDLKLLRCLANESKSICNKFYNEISFEEIYKSLIWNTTDFNYELQNNVSKKIETTFSNRLNIDKEMVNVGLSNLAIKMLDDYITSLPDQGKKALLDGLSEPLIKDIKNIKGEIQNYLESIIFQEKYSPKVNLPNEFKKLFNPEIIYKSWAKQIDSAENEFLTLIKSYPRDVFKMSKDVQKFFAKQSIKNSGKKNHQ